VEGGGRSKGGSGTGWRGGQASPGVTRRRRAPSNGMGRMRTLSRAGLLLLILGVVLLVNKDAAASPASTTRVSVDGAGNEGNGSSQEPAISADGRFVAFHSDASNLVAGDTNDVGDVFVRDRQT